MPTETSSSLNVRGGQRSWLQPLATQLLRWAGWKTEYKLPAVEKFVIIVAPHTSNWDLPLGFIAGHSMELLSRWRYGFMAKASVFREPLGTLIRWMGGIPVDRSSAHNAVEQMIEAFQRHERLMLAITPEGTRKRTTYWKSGFYHIALGAGVPIVPAFMDYQRKLIRIGAALWPTGQVEADLDQLRQFYAGVTAKFPAQFGDIQFKPSDA